MPLGGIPRVRAGRRQLQPGGTQPTARSSSRLDGASVTGESTNLHQSSLFPLHREELLLQLRVPERQASGAEPAARPSPLGPGTAGTAGGTRAAAVGSGTALPPQGAATLHGFSGRNEQTHHVKETLPVTRGRAGSVLVSPAKHPLPGCPLPCPAQPVPAGPRVAVSSPGGSEREPAVADSVSDMGTARRAAGNTRAWPERGGRKHPSARDGNTRASACEPGRREMVAPRCSSLSFPSRQRSQPAFSSAEPRGAGGDAG